MARKNSPQISFDAQLVLFKYFLHELKLDSLESLSEQLNRAEYEGVNESGNTYFYEYLAHVCRMRNANITSEKLRLYDENICRHTRHIGEKRGGLHWKYFQYVALLFTEIYLDRYFFDRENFCKELNAWLKEFGQVEFQEYTADKLNKLAFMCATGSGKTLIMHMNILQYQHYLKRAKRLNSKLSINNIIVLAPNEGMSKQHLEELALSSIPARLFDKNHGSLFDEVIIIDVNKLKEEGKIKTVSVDSFEQNNLVLVDEGHRGLSGDVWYDYRTRLSEEGFAFEYSATFKQALNINAAGNTQRAKDERALVEEYGKSIIMDYSYKYFYGDGYGKDYRIYNLKGNVDSEQKHLYLVGCLLFFYQQTKLFIEKADELRNFRIEQPLMVFVGNRVVAPVKSNNLSQAEKELLTDVEEVLLFLNKFLSNRERSIEHIRAILENDTGLINESGQELFYQDFQALHEIFGHDINPAKVFADILRLVFNNDSNSNEPRLRMKNISQISGEIGLKVGEYGEYFGVINIGDTSGLLKNCERKGIIVGNEEFIAESLFGSINAANSKIKMLIGSRKFTEGWNSWRVSTMGLINFAKGEGSQAIQLFGRGVRLKGYGGCLKRSGKLDLRVKPKYIELLETLNIFGVKAQYMEDFKSYLEKEGAPVNDSVRKYYLPVISRFDKVKNKNLYTIKLKSGVNFKQQAARLILDKPDAGFLRYLIRNKTVLDCRSKIQTIDSDSTLSLKMDVVSSELTLPLEILPLLDMQRIFEELQEYKAEKRYCNISIVKGKLLEILGKVGWYGLLIPKNHLAINTAEKLEAATDYAIMLLKSYMDKFFKYAKARWEAPQMTCAVLDEDDSNFVDEYTLTYTSQNAKDTVGEELGKFIEGISAALQANNGLDSYKKIFHERLVMFDFPSHLYAPLICLEKSNLKIQVSPVALNHDEMKFADYLKTYVETHDAELANKSLYLLRNKSKVGIGFFEADNFYPDYILWIDTPDKQYVTFIDPKGLLHSKPDDPKITFYKKIKDLESRLSSAAKVKQIILNSFIMSSTSSAELNMWWSTSKVNADREYRETRNVYTLDNVECVNSMIKKILDS